MSERPLVSVIITNYNYGAFLAAALDSVFAQTYAPHEVIVVDDGSTDDSRAVLESYPARVVFQQNAGQAAALNAGVRAAGGDIICTLDADDLWLPHKLERVVASLDGAAHWLRHKLEVVDARLTRSGIAIPSIRRSGFVPVAPHRLAERLLTASTSAIAFRRDIVEDAFPLPEAQLRYDADAFLLARLAGSHAGWQLDEVLGYYRRHGHQQFAKPDDLQRLLERQIEVGTLVAQALGAPEPVANYKHRAVLHALERKPRRADVLNGLAAGMRLLRTPALMARQTGALLFAAAAPNAWLEKLKREQGLV